jgi:hypothetical protein
MADFSKSIAWLGFWPVKAVKLWLLNLIHNARLVLLWAYGAWAAYRFSGLVRCGIREGNMRRIAGYATLAFCVIFSIATLASSVIQLLQGQASDTNLHILNRAALCVIGTLMVTLTALLPFGSPVLRHAIAYAISMALVFLYVWNLGHFEELHPNAYRDIFLNFTIVFAAVSVAIGLWKRYRKKRAAIPSK